MECFTTKPITLCCIPGLRQGAIPQACHALNCISLMF
uniref:Uncharacterized protein n=1 Tax=Anguilla anguilla TaxID=7936 RepID=A0A0E9WBJ8_ANGAN